MSSNPRVSNAQSRVRGLDHPLDRGELSRLFRFPLFISPIPVAPPRGTDHYAVLGINPDLPSIVLQSK